MKKGSVYLIVFLCAFFIVNAVCYKRKLHFKFDFPNEMSAVYKGKDTTIVISDSTAKFVILYDSTLCTLCQTSNLFIWDYFTSQNSEGFQTLIIFSANQGDMSSVKDGLKQMQYDFPVYIDSGYSFMKMNLDYLWGDINNHFFLLDENQEISILGFPFLEKEKEEEYIEAVENFKFRMR